MGTRILSEGCWLCGLQQGAAGGGVRLNCDCKYDAGKDAQQASSPVEDSHSKFRDWRHHEGQSQEMVSVGRRGM